MRKFNYLNAYFVALAIGLSASYIYAEVCSSDRAGCCPCSDSQNSLVLVSPDGKSRVSISATNQGAFISMSGPKGRNLNLFSEGVTDQTGISVFRHGVKDQAISIGLVGDDATIQKLD